MKRVVFNQKGGVGKSSIASNLAAISAKAGIKTLLIDLDSQCNSTLYLLGREFDKAKGGISGAHHNIVDSLGKRTIAEYFKSTLGFKLLPSRGVDYVRQTPFANLDLIAASPELADIQSALESKHKIYKLRDLFKGLPEYQAIYIDTPPMFNFYTVSALIAADTCLIPFDCDDFSRQALYTLMNNVDEIKNDHNDQLFIEGIIVNQYQPRANFPQRIVHELKSESLPILDATISSSVKMKESHDVRIPLIHYLPKHKLTQEIVQVFHELNPKTSIEHLQQIDKTVAEPA